MLTRSLRPLAGLARPISSSSSTAPSRIARALATEAARPPRSGEYTTVEDLHQKTAHEILNERDRGSAGGTPPLVLQGFWDLASAFTDTCPTRVNTAMRHFTVRVARHHVRRAPATGTR